MEKITRIGMDTSKHVFQLHGVNAVEERHSPERGVFTQNPRIPHFKIESTFNIMLFGQVREVLFWAK